MNCDWVKQNVALYVYEELPDDQRHELERHVERCESCSVELGAFRAFHHALGTVRAPEVSPNLLAASRMRLSEALEDAEQHRGWNRFTFDFAGWLQQARLAPALVVALIMVGFLVGGLALVFGPTWWLFWVGGGVAAVGGLLALATNIFEDWY